MNQVKALKVGKDVGCLLEKIMELGEGNRGALEESSWICSRMHLIPQFQGSSG